MGCLQNLPTADTHQAHDWVLPRTTHGLMVQCPLRIWATFKELVLRGLPPTQLASFVSRDSGFLWVFLASPEMGELIECYWVPPSFLSLVLGFPILHQSLHFPKGGRLAKQASAASARLRASPAWWPSLPCPGHTFLCRNQTVRWEFSGGLSALWSSLHLSAGRCRASDWSSGSDVCGWNGVRGIAELGLRE